MKQYVMEGKVYTASGNYEFLEQFKNANPNTRTYSVDQYIEKIVSRFAGSDISTVDDVVEKWKKDKRLRVMDLGSEVENDPRRFISETRGRSRFGFGDS